MGSELALAEESSYSTQLISNSKSFEQTSKSKCLLNERYNYVFVYYGCSDASRISLTLQTVNPSGESGLAVTLWVIAIICLLLVIFFCIVVLVGMTILVFISFHQHTSLQHSQQMQIQLLVALSKCLRKKLHCHYHNVGSKKKIQNPRCQHDTMPFYQSNHANHFFSPLVSNSPFHPRNNTPVSSNLNLSFSSHASLSNSGPPSFSSISPSISEDGQNDGSQDSSGLTVVQPIRERIFQRSRREGIDERDWQEREQGNLVPDDFMRRNEFLQLPHDRNGQAFGINKWSGTSHSLQLRPQTFNSPREYWL